MQKIKEYAIKEKVERMRVCASSDHWFNIIVQGYCPTCGHALSQKKDD